LLGAKCGHHISLNLREGLRHLFELFLLRWLGVAKKASGKSPTALQFFFAIGF
jgi:hypothetical protein